MDGELLSVELRGRVDRGWDVSGTTVRWVDGSMDRLFGTVSLGTVLRSVSDAEVGAAVSGIGGLGSAVLVGIEVLDVIELGIAVLGVAALEDSGLAGTVFGVIVPGVMVASGPGGEFGSDESAGAPSDPSRSELGRPSDLLP